MVDDFTQKRNPTNADILFRFLPIQTTGWEELGLQKLYRWNMKYLCYCYQEFYEINALVFFSLTVKVLIDGSVTLSLIFTIELVYRWTICIAMEVRGTIWNDWNKIPITILVERICGYYWTHRSGHHRFTCLKFHWSCLLSIWDSKIPE